MASLWLVLAVLAGLAAIAVIWWGLTGDPHRGPETREHPPGRPYPTSDGLWVASRGEQQIAAWLSDRGIAYRYEPEVAGGLTPDFHVEGTEVVVEYWGMTGRDSYEERMVEKVEQYEEHGYEVVSVFPSHLGRLEEVLERELAKCGIHDPRNP